MRLDETTLPVYAKGAAILGAGGGGSTRPGLLAALETVEEKGPVEVISLDDVPDDELIVPAGLMGSPNVSQEKLGNPEMGAWMRDILERETGKRVCAFMPAEIAGQNALAPVIWGAHTGLPVVDADGMGRAFPEAQMFSMNVAGVSPSPSALIDERGHKVMLRNLDALRHERCARSMVVAFGGSAGNALYVCTGAQARTAVIAGSVTRALRIGQVLADAPADRIRALLDHLGGQVIITGKVSDIERHTSGGFVRGHALIDGVGVDSGRLVRIEIQNENLIVLEEGGVLVSVPDIITLLDTQTGDVIFTETIRYGQRGTLVAFPSPDIWRTPEGLALVAPRAFGYDFDYEPLELLTLSRNGEER
ncbi:DUF917 domain-containing protein [Allosalinactinospora lopnorensis]|uniref:DUF917 domain-containing protein n=1 Tax=Allosalinactinospora lopnorensis TaxID=1352348 RepID=UPI000623D641|nr:DUF917 domain-containing protein [Allosalinactinospora lopnorensis]